MKYKYWLLLGLWIFSINELRSQNETVVTQSKNSLRLLQPSGKFSVGRHWASIKDSSRGQREIPIFIYYPIQQKAAETYILPTEEWRAQYLPVLQKRLGDSAAGAIVWGKAAINQDASFNTKDKYPLVLFSPGMNWSTLEYSFIIQEIVSAGYIVVAVNSSPAAPVLQSPAGTFLTAERPTDIYRLVADDLSFTFEKIKTLKGNLHKVLNQVDFTRIAIAGHSLGGAAALLAASDINNVKNGEINPGQTGAGTLSTDLANIRVKAAVNMDGDLMNASQKATPSSSVLFLNQLPQAIARNSFAEMKADTSVGWRYQLMASAGTNAASGKYISISGMYHSNFQDYALLPVDMIPENIRKTRLGPIDGRACLQLITKVLIFYFDEELKNKKADWKLLESQQPVLRVIDIKSS